MKKTMIVAAMALCGVAFGDVESANVVGYTTCDAPAAGKYKAMSVQFENTATEKAIAIADLVQCAAPKGGAACGATSDQIWLWDTAAGDWVKYFYRKIGAQPAVGWCKQGATTATTDTIGNGETFFFYRGTGATASTLTLAGEVHPFAAQAQYVAPAAGKYKFLGYPWPTPMPIADFAKYQGAPKGGAACGATSDQIWLWDTAAGDWVKYFYRKIGAQPAVGWCKQGATTVTTDTIPVGEGFFFYRGTGATADTITFTYGEN